MRPAWSASGTWAKPRSSIRSAAGFQEYYGFLGGARSFFPNEGTVASGNKMYRGQEVLAENEPYTTDTFAREANAFIDKHAKEPWFLYLTFNAVHTPMHATESTWPAFPAVQDENRRTYCAMMSAMDDAIGAVLEQAGREEADREHADLLRQRQRRAAGQLVEQRSAAGQQGPNLGRRHPRAVPRAVEGDAARRQDLRPAGDPARFSSHRAGRGRGRSQGCEVRRRQPAAAPERRGDHRRRTTRSTGGSARRWPSATATTSS